MSGYYLFLGARVFHGEDNLETSVKSLYELRADDIQGNSIDFERFKGKVTTLNNWKPFFDDFL